MAHEPPVCPNGRRVTERTVFIVGCPRNGTTLLRDLLRSHPRLTFPPESGGLPGRTGCTAFRRTTARRACSPLASSASHSVRDWNLTLQPADLERGRSFTAVVVPAYEAWAGSEGKPRWGDKTPQNVLAIPLLIGLFPTAQFVHVVRDGRDAALSLAGKGWGQRSAYTAAGRLLAPLRRAGRRDGRPLGAARYHELQYEDMLAEPEVTLRALCAFLGEDFDPSLLRPTRIPLAAGRPQPWDSRFDERLGPASVGRWRREMSEPEEIVFESVAGELLVQLGSRPGVTRPIRPSSACAGRPGTASPSFAGG